MSTELKRYYFVRFGDDYQWASLGDDGFLAAAVLKDKLIEAINAVGEDGQALSVEIKTESLSEDDYLGMQDY